jgi:hypothetical protein
VRVSIERHGYAGVAEQMLTKRRWTPRESRSVAALYLRSCQRMSGNPAQLSCHTAAGRRARTLIVPLGFSLEAILGEGFEYQRTKEQTIWPMGKM